MQSGSQFF